MSFSRHNQKHRISLANLSPDIIVVDDSTNETASAEKKDSSVSWPIMSRGDLDGTHEMNDHCVNKP